MKYAALVLLLTVGCCKPKIVYVPVAAPEPPVVVRPVLPIEQLKEGDTWEAERKLWVATVKALAGYAGELEVLLDAYRNKPEPKKEQK